MSKDTLESEARDVVPELLPPTQRNTRRSRRNHRQLPFAPFGPQIESDSNAVNRSAVTHRPPITPPPRAVSDVYKNPTPYKTSLHLVRTEKGFENDNVKDFLRAQFKDNIVRDYPVVDFISKVWKFNPEHIPQGTYLLHRAYSANYLCGQSGNNLPTERSCYIPLVSLLAHLILQLIANGALLSRVPSFINMHDRVAQGQYANFKPDIVWAWALEEAKHAWEWIGLSGEVQKKKFPKDTPRESIHLSQLRQDSSPASSNRKRKHEPSSEYTDEPAPRKARKSKSNAKSTSTGGSASPSGEHKPLTPKELQTAKYLNEMASHGVRSYVTGFLLEETTISLWYADRMGLVKSQPFDMFQHSHLLLLFVAAVASSTPANLGVSPFLKFPLSSFESYEDASFELPPNTLDIEENEIAEMLQFRVDAQRALFTAYGALGRGTSVVPLRPANSSAKAICGSDEEVVAKISWQSDSQDHGKEDNHIRVIRRRLQETGKTDILKHIVDLKCSLDCSMAQMGLPRANMDLPSPSDTRLCRTLVLKAYLKLESIKSPAELKTIFIGTLTGHHWVWENCRILHRDISASNIMFYRVGEQVVGVLCDWDLAKDFTGITWTTDQEAEEYREEIAAPNRESSLNAEGSSRSSIGCTSKSRTSPAHETTGDDIATKDETANRPASDHPRVRYRTGTGPFMAIDLLRSGDQPPLHRYRHDLESFFYVLAWFCAEYDPDKQTLGYINSWHDPELKKIGDVKKLFLENDKAFFNTFTHIHATYKPFIKTLRKLQFKFHRVMRSGDNIRGHWHDIMEAIEGEEDKEEIDGLKEKLQVMIQERNGMMTFEIFTSILEKAKV